MMREREKEGEKSITPNSNLLPVTIGNFKHSGSQFPYTGMKKCLVGIECKNIQKSIAHCSYMHIEKANYVTIINYLMIINFSLLKTNSLTSITKKIDVIWAGLFFFDS